MECSQIKISSRCAWSYAWNKGIDNKASCMTKWGNAMHAFLSALFSDYSVSIAEADSMYAKHSESIFYKEYTKMNQRKVDSVYNSTSANKKNHPLEGQEEKITAVRNATPKGAARGKALYSPGEVIISVMMRKNIIHCSVEEFKQRMRAGRFLAETHYIVYGDVEFDEEVPEENLCLPKYLTIVKGTLKLNGQYNLRNLPMMLVFELKVGDIFHEGFDHRKFIDTGNWFDRKVIFDRFNKAVHLSFANKRDDGDYGFDSDIVRGMTGLVSFPSQFKLDYNMS